MAATQGNKFWMMRSKHGPNPKFKNGEDLWDACCEYFDYVENNPLWESKVVQKNGEPEEFALPKMRAMTIIGLCVFLDIDQSTWEEWRKREDLSRVVRKCDDIIRDQKFSGAAAGLLNANIIARDLGLTDKQETNHGVSDPLAELIKKVSGNTIGPSDDV